MNYYSQGDFSECFTLIKVDRKYEGGHAVDVEAARAVYGNQYAAFREAYAEGETQNTTQKGLAAINKRVVFEVHPEDYSSEDRVDHHGVRYNVERVFINAKRRIVELHCSKAG